MVGYDTEMIEMTRTDGSSVRYYISPKTYRILHVEYEVAAIPARKPTTYRESYTDWRVYQTALVPIERRLRQNGNIVQTININLVQFDVKIDDTVFLQL